MARAQIIDFLAGGISKADGSVLAGGKVYTYNAGTTTPRNTFTARDESSSHTNPIILNSAGRAQVWARGAYKIRVDDANDVTQFTFDDMYYGLEDGTSFSGGASTGSANAQALSVTPAIYNYTDGAIFHFKAGFTNTLAATLNINSMGAKTVAARAYQLVAGQSYIVRYSSSDDSFSILGARIVGWTSYTPTITAFSSMTVSALVLYHCKFFIVDNKITIKIGADYTLGGTASNAVTISLPSGITAAAAENVSNPTEMNGGTANEIGFIYVANGASTLAVHRAGLVNYALGVGRQVRGSVTFEIA